MPATSSFNPRPAFFCGATSHTNRYHLSRLFQSAPRVLLRGDRREAGKRHVETVSIRAPRSSAGRPQTAFNLLTTLQVSIRAPRSSAGRHCIRRQQSDDCQRFNPRPAFFCGATTLLAACGLATGVSIRAPRSSAGRHPNPDVVAAAQWFQSAPRVLLRGDAIGYSYTAEELRFNPRPAFFCGATATAVNYAATRT